MCSALHTVAPEGDTMTTTTITAAQIEDLFTYGGTLDLPNGDTVDRDQLKAYILSNEIDTDDAGTPLDTQWQMLADVLGAPDPGKVTELVEVTASAAALRDTAATPYAAVLAEAYGVVSITVWDAVAEATIAADRTAIRDQSPLASTGELGAFVGGLANPDVKTKALRWLETNGWATLADPDRILGGYQDSLWRTTEPLPVRPADDELSSVTIAASRIGQAEDARDAAIRDALDAGHSVISIANAAGLSRARIYQIRDGRR